MSALVQGPRAHAATTAITTAITTHRHHRCHRHRRRHRHRSSPHQCTLPALPCSELSLCAVGRRRRRRRTRRLTAGVERRGRRAPRLRRTSERGPGGCCRANPFFLVSSWKHGSASPPLVQQRRSLRTLDDAALKTPRHRRCRRSRATPHHHDRHCPWYTRPAPGFKPREVASALGTSLASLATYLWRC